MMFLSSFLLVSAAAFPSVNPLQFPSYEQEVVATFADEATAQAATCVVTPLPDGATVAYSCRWDDTTEAHVRKAEMMKRAGQRGNFYFVGGTGSSFFKEGSAKLLPLGHAIGNHTLRHKFMLGLLPNDAFRDIAENRIRLETLLGRTVTSYVSPFGWQRDPLDARHEQLLAEAVVATGHFVTQDNPMPWSGMDARTWMWTNRFSSNDRNPDRTQFETGFAKQDKLARENPLVPRVTLGTHSWCNDAGNAKQEAWLKEFFQPADGVSLNDWEYGAYRYQYLHGGVSKVGVKGRCATFRVTRYAPVFVGDAIPLSLAFTRGQSPKTRGQTPKAEGLSPKIGGLSPDVEGLSPVAVTCGRALEKGLRGTWKLPQDEKYVKKASISTKIRGLSLEIVPDEAAATLTVRVRNGTGAALSELYVAAALPPRWEARRLVTSQATLKEGATFEKVFALGKQMRAAYALGCGYYPVSVDFMSEQGPVRLWGAAETARVPLPADAPSRVVKTWGPGLESVFASVDWTAVSQPGAALPDAANWRALMAESNDWPDAVNKGIKTWGTSGVNEEVVKLLKNGNHARYFVYDFMSASACERKLRLSVSPRYRSPKFWLNGVPSPFTRNGQSIRVQKGANRLIIRADATQNGFFTDVVSMRLD